MICISSTGIQKISLYVCLIQILIIMKHHLLFLSFIFYVSGHSQIWLDNTCPIEENITKIDYISAKTNNLLTLLIDQEGKLVINGNQQESISEIELKESVYEFLTNPNQNKSNASSPKQAIIALGAYGEYPEYEMILTYLREVYLYAWDNRAKEQFNSPYTALGCKKRSKIRQDYFPYRIFEMDNDSPKEKNKYPIPSFAGDVIDN